MCGTTAINRKWEQKEEALTPQTNVFADKDTSKLNSPSVTVIIATRNRGAMVARTVQSVLLNEYPTFDLRVIDQSEDNLTQTSLHPFLTDHHLRYIRTATSGLQTARNLGVCNTQSEIIAITDDDCETPPNWLQELIVAFNVDSRIAIVYGNVLPGPHRAANP